MKTTDAAVVVTAKRTWDSCPCCGDIVNLKKDGTIRSHGSARTGAGFKGKGCAGSGTLPKPEKAEAPRSMWCDGVPSSYSDG